MILTDEQRADVLQRFRAYHQVHAAWGSLHIVLDDDNVGDDDVQFCIDYARDSNGAEGEALARILSTMSRTQRRKIASIA